ncbi:MAG: glycosyltransferase family 2 protein [Candidatus Electrothrix sp. YB6]
MPSVPTVSIITVSRNAAATISDCLDSVAGQKQQNISAEHIIVDGVSTDATPRILADKIAEKRSCISRLISEPDKGIYDAMNKGLALAEGEIIGFLNADDLYASDDVLAQVCNAFADPAVHSCYGDLLYVDAAQPEKIVRFWRAGSYDAKKFYWGWMPPHPTFFVRRQVYEQYGQFNTALGSAADYELMLRFLLGYRISTVYIPQVLVRMRTGGISNVTLANRLRANRMDRRAWAVNGLRPYLWTLWMKPARKISQWFVHAR